MFIWLPLSDQRLKKKVTILQIEDVTPDLLAFLDHEAVC